MLQSLPRLRGFVDAGTRMFELDNTPYPHRLLWQPVDSRIRGDVAKFLKVTTDGAFKVQKNYDKRYGTTMRSAI